MIGFHASHEQYSPRDLLRLVKAAEKAGFQAVYLHHAGRDMETFRETFGARVIPALCR